MNKKKNAILFLIAIMALPIFIQSCGAKKCGCMGNLNYVAPRKNK
jgi:hypothetical protein